MEYYAVIILHDQFVISIRKNMKTFNVYIIYLKNGVENVGGKKEREKNIFKKIIPEEDSLLLYIGPDYLDLFVNM